MPFARLFQQVAYAHVTERLGILKLHDLAPQSCAALERILRVFFIGQTLAQFADLDELQ